MEVACMHNSNTCTVISLLLSGIQPLNLTYSQIISPSSSFRSARKLFGILHLLDISRVVCCPEHDLPGKPI